MPPTHHSDRFPLGRTAALAVAVFLLAACDSPVQPDLSPAPASPAGYATSALDADLSGTFLKTYGPGIALAVVATADGGYAMLTYPFGVLKLDPAGGPEWNKIYSSNGRAEDLVQTADGGFLAVGNMSVPNGSRLRVFKLDADGQLGWDRVYDSGHGGYDFGTTGMETADGHFLVTGTTRIQIGVFLFHMAWALKLDSTGEVVWERMYHASKSSSAHAVVESPAGGYVLAGRRRDPSSSHEVWVAHVSADDGAILTENIYTGDTTWSLNGIGSVIATSDGGFAITGEHRSPVFHNNDAWVLKLGADLEVEWDMTLGTAIGDIGVSIIEVADGYVVGADGPFSHPRGRVLIFKIDGQGQVLWQRATDLDDGFRLAGLVPAAGGGFAVGGWSRVIESLYLMRLAGDGQVAACEALETSSSPAGTQNAFASAVATPLHVIASVVTAGPPPTVAAGGLDQSLTCPTTLEVDIMIAPGGDATINPDSRGLVPVAILSTPTLDAAVSVDRASLTFGATGDEDSLDRRGPQDVPNCGAEDVDEDELPDLVCHFWIQSTDLEQGDTEAVLKGQLLDGIRIIGTGELQTVGRP